MLGGAVVNKKPIGGNWGNCSMAAFHWLCCYQAGKELSSSPQGPFLLGWQSASLPVSLC